MSFKKNPALNRRFEITCEPEVRINVPRTEHHGAYNGPLCGVEEAGVIEGMIARGSNLVRVKEPTPTPTTKTARGLKTDENSSGGGDGKTNNDNNN